MYLLEDKPIIVEVAYNKIQLPNFLGQSKDEVKKWLNETNEKNGAVEVVFRNVSSSKYSTGQVTYQSSTKEEIEIGSKLTINVCTSQTTAGKPVPNMVGMTETEFINWCQINQVTYRIKTSYHNTTDTGVIISHEKAGTSIQTHEVLEATKSLGRVQVPDFDGKQKTEVITWLNDVNANNAYIQVIYQVEASPEATDEVIGQSIEAGSVDIGTSITIRISD
jgi:beta-lactam-binding protein with PASTA domain